MESGEESPLSTPEPTMRDVLPVSLLVVVTAVLVWSGIGPKDRLTWFLEVFPVFVGAAILIPTFRRFRLTNLLYVLLAIHAIILMVGGHYTYAEVPLGDWIRDWLGLARNHYDRLGHLAQGFVPAILAREILVRHSVVRGRGWLFFVVVSICLGFSAFYELLEWSVAEFSGESSDAFLGTQGDVWDTQKDMALALVGSILAQVILGRAHDRQIESIRDASK
jgi:putative membrane protein